MSERVIYLKCDYCYAQYEGEEAQAASEGWFRLDHDAFDEPKDYCSTECMVSDL